MFCIMTLKMADNGAGNAIEAEPVTMRGKVDAEIGYHETDVKAATDDTKGAQ